MKEERKDLMIEVARMYYEDRLNQAEIAARVNMTRSNVSKLLSAARDNGIVEIRIIEPSSRAVQKANQLKAHFGLLDVIVVPSAPTYEETLVMVGRRAARYLESLLHEGIRIGFSWGTSLYQMVEQLSQFEIPSSVVVEFHGGIGSRNLSVDGNELARRFALRLRAAPYLVQAPLIVRSVELKKLLIREPGIAGVLEMAESVEIAFLGIGTSEPRYSATLRAGLVTEGESRKLWKKGAVGMVCGHYFDINGNLVDDDINQRAVSIELGKLHDIPRTVGVALGERKVEALIGVLRGKYINCLITDEQAATRILKEVLPKEAEAAR